jgi:hypothetical protein
LTTIMETPAIIMDLALETLALNADSAGNLAAPAASAESVARLRRELADCIADRDAADKAARAAKAVADRAKDEAARPSRPG